MYTVQLLFSLLLLLFSRHHQNHVISTGAAQPHRELHSGENPLPDQLLPLPLPIPALAFAVASGYPKASALGLSTPQ